METMRRKDRALADEETLGILANGEYGILSMATPEGGYGIPLNYATDGQVMYFHCATEGQKLRFLAENNQVSFCVVGKTKLLPEKFGTLYESVIVFGEIEETDDAEKQRGLEKILEKYSSDFIPEGMKYIENAFQRVKILKLTIRSISGKARKH